MSRQKSDMSNSLRVIFIKIIIKINIIKFTLRIPISLKENTAIPEPSLNYSIFSSAYKAVKSYLIILLVPNQPRISFSVARE